MFLMEVSAKFIQPTGKWIFIGSADHAEFEIEPIDSLFLLEVEVRSRRLSRFILETEYGPVPSFINYKVVGSVDDESGSYPLAGTVLRPLLSTPFKVQVDDLAAPVYARLTEVRPIIAGPEASRYVRGLVVIDTKIPHFLQKAVCEAYGARPAEIKCRGFNSVGRFLNRVLGPKSSVSIGKLDKDSSRPDKIIQIDIGSSGRSADARMFKSRGPIVKRKRILCEYAEIVNESRKPSSQGSEIECEYAKSGDENIMHADLSSETSDSASESSV